LVLAVVLALAATGCSHSDDKADAAADPENVVADAAGGDSAVPLQCAGPITIGVVTDLTGGLSIYGTELGRGVAVGMAYVSNGPVGAGATRTYQVDDCEIRVVYADDQSSPEIAGIVARRLIDDEGASLLIGSVGVGTASVLRQVAEERDVILLATADTATGLSEADFTENTFLLALNPAQQAYATCGYFAAALGAHTFAQIAPDFPAGWRATAAYRSACQSTGGEFVVADEVLATATTDFTPSVEAMVAADPDAVLLTWPAGGIGALLDTVAGDFSTTTAFGVTFPPDAVLPLFFDSAIGWTSPITYHYTSPHNDANDFLVDEVGSMGTTPDQFDALGMNAVLLAVAALRATGGVVAPGTLRQTIEGIEMTGPKGKITVRITDHLAIQDTYVVTLLNTDDPDRKFYDTLATVRPEPPCLLEGDAAVRCG
jgi:ABC-type branched-subunit amino acid transport system substrate-binding protein